MPTLAARRPRTIAETLLDLWSRVLFPGRPELVSSSSWQSHLLVVILPAFLLYPTLSFHLLEPDEGRYAQIAKEMFTNGVWVVPTLQGEPYLDKPPFFYWLVKLSYSLFGVSEAAARLVPALAVHATILAVHLLGRRSLGAKSAFCAAMLLTIAPGYIAIARILTLDGLLTCCVTLSVLCGFEAVRTGRLKLSWWIASALFSGLGFLTKGPISEVLLFPPLFVFALLNRETARPRFRDLVLFAIIVLAVNLPWYVAMYQQRPEFLKYFFWEHNVMRFLKPFDHLQPVWYYGPILLAGFLPGVCAALPYLREMLIHGRSTGRTRSQAGGFWLLAGLWCVAFFSFSGSKLPTYILPAYPPLCLALGESLARSGRYKRWPALSLFVFFFTLLMILHHVALPWYARERSPMGRPELVAPLVLDPEATIVTYPRNCDSVAFMTGRSDFDRVRAKDVNELIVQSENRKRTVMLFTHDHSFRAFQFAIPHDSPLKVVRAIDLRREKSGNAIIDKLLGATPWGLCDVVVLEPRR